MGPIKSTATIACEEGCYAALLACEGKESGIDCDSQHEHCIAECSKIGRPGAE